MSKLLLNELAGKYYPMLNDMLTYLAINCVGGEEIKLVFPAGSIIIKLK